MARCTRCGRIVEDQHECYPTQNVPSTVVVEQEPPSTDVHLNADHIRALLQRVPEKVDGPEMEARDRLREALRRCVR